MPAQTPAPKKLGIGFTMTDSGRRAAGSKSKSDCITRAIVNITGRPYAEVAAVVAEIAASQGLPRTHDVDTMNRAERAEIKQGIRIKRPRIFDLLCPRYRIVKVRLPKGEKPTFAEAYRRYGDCLVTTTRHVAAIVRGDLVDTKDIRTYQWGEPPVTRERKAASVYTLLPPAAQPVPVPAPPPAPVQNKSKAKAKAKPAPMTECRYCGKLLTMSRGNFSRVEGSPVHRVCAGELRRLDPESQRRELFG